MEVTSWHGHSCSQIQQRLGAIKQVRSAINEVTIASQQQLEVDERVHHSVRGVGACPHFVLALGSRSMRQSVLCVHGRRRGGGSRSSALLAKLFLLVCVCVKEEG